MKTEEKSSSLIGLRRGIQVLEGLSSTPDGMKFGELKEYMNLPSATLSRLLSSLDSEGLICRANRGANYTLGERFLVLSRRASGTFSVEEKMALILKEAAHETGDSYAYYEPDDSGVVLHSKFEMSDSFYFGEVGKMINYIISTGHLSINPFPLISLSYNKQKAKSILKIAIPKKGDVSEYFKIRQQNIFKNGYHIFGHPGSDNMIRIGAPVFSGKKGPFKGVVGTITHSNNYIDMGKNQFVNTVKSTAERLTELLVTP